MSPRHWAGELLLVDSLAVLGPLTSYGTVAPARCSLANDSPHAPDDVGPVFTHPTWVGGCEPAETGTFEAQVAAFGAAP